MNPASSVIVFSTASGTGFGLLALLGVLAVAGLLPQAGGFSQTATGIGLAVVVVGLLVSTRHLGRPERMLRAPTQWRLSWLSREGVAALATLAAGWPSRQPAAERRSGCSVSSAPCWRWPPWRARR